jgi:hypothetical protein
LHRIVISDQRNRKCFFKRCFTKKFKKRQCLYIFIVTMSNNASEVNLMPSFTFEW